MPKVIHNPDRFNMSYAPVGRNYTSGITPESVIPESLAYVRNKWDRSKITTETTFAFLKEWQS